jgi:hypothetical protein
VTITKWTRIWEERRRDVALEFVPTTESDAVAELPGAADVAFVRLPVQTEGLAVIRLYSEKHVVVASADDPIADLDELTLDDLDSYTVHDPQASIMDTIALVAAGVGVVVLPHSIARAHSRKDLVSRPVTDAPETEIAIAWVADEETPDIEEFVGIVRGRSANSSRANPTPPAEKPEKPSKAPTTSKGAPAKNTGGKAKAKRTPYATSGGGEAKNRSGSPNSPKARNARKRKGR